MADGVAVEARSKPAVTLVGEAFARGAELKRKALGLESLPLLVIPVPETEEMARAEAARIADAVAAALVGQRPE